MRASSCFATLGAYTLNNNAVDIGLSGSSAFSASACASLSVPIVPCVLGFVLGPMLELMLRRSLAISQGDPSVFLTRPISLRAADPRRRAPVRAAAPAFRSRRAEDAVPARLRCATPTRNRPALRRNAPFASSAAIAAFARLATDVGLHLKNDREVRNELDGSCTIRLASAPSWRCRRRPASRRWTGWRWWRPAAPAAARIRWPARSRRRPAEGEHRPQSAQVVNIAGGGGMVAFAQFISSKEGDGNSVLTQGAGHVLFPISNKTEVSMTTSRRSRFSRASGRWSSPKADSGINSIKALIAKFKADSGLRDLGGRRSGATDHVFLANLLIAAPGRTRSS